MITTISPLAASRPSSTNFDQSDHQADQGARDAFARNLVFAEFGARQARSLDWGPFTDRLPSEPRVLANGRVLREAFRNGAGDSAMPAQRERTYLSSNDTGPVTHLSVTQVGSTRYFNRAWVE